VADLATRARRFAASAGDPRAYLGALRLVHWYNRTHVRERRKLTLGPGAEISPLTSIANGERVSIGARTNIGDRCHLWAGDTSGRIVIGDDCLLAPDCFLTASDYSFEPGTPVKQQPRQERDVVLGDDVWLGTRVVVVAGVTIGDGCVVGAGSVVTRSLPPGSIAAGIPARVLHERGARAPADAPA
jgi:acetyltransferase-like isoleucine patch superfamily enzyme